MLRAIELGMFSASGGKFLSTSDAASSNQKLLQIRLAPSALSRTVRARHRPQLFVKIKQLISR